MIPFDEIEKAHPDVFNVLLQILDDGRLTDGHGRTVVFRNTVVIMTSNVGSQHILEYGRSDFEKAEDLVLFALRETFKPEFLNRVDDVIVFRQLTRDDLGFIVDLQVGHVEKLLADRKLRLEVTPDAKELLIGEGYDPVYGARPLKWGGAQGVLSGPAGVSHVPSGRRLSRCHLLHVANIQQYVAPLRHGFLRDISPALRRHPGSAFLVSGVTTLGGHYNGIGGYMFRPPRVPLWVAVGLLFAALAPPGWAQTRGNTVPVIHLPSFSTTGQSMWGPATAPSNIDFPFVLVSESFIESGQTGDVSSLEGSEFGARIRAATNGQFDLRGRIQVPGTGAVNITYPVNVELKIPEPNSFRDGEEVAIESSWTLRNGWSFTTDAASASISFGTGFGFGASASTDVCIFDCVTSNFFPPINIPNTDFELLSLSSTGGVSFPLLSVAFPALPHTFSFLESEQTGVSGTVDVPRSFTVPSVGADGRTLTAQGSHRFVDISFDLDSFLNKVGVPIPFGQQTPNIGGAAAGYDIIDVSMPTTIDQGQRFVFNPDLQVALAFPTAVPWRVTTPGGTQLASGFGNVVQFDVGNTLHVVFPSGQKTPMSSASQYELNNTFTSNTDLTFGAGFVETLMRLDITVPSVTITPAVTVDVCHETTVTLDLAGVIPDESCPVTTPAVTSPQIAVHLGPLLQKTQPLDPRTVGLFPPLGENCTPGTPGCGGWTLQGFNGFSGDPFDLDPENPIIAVSTSVVSGLATGTGLAGSIVQTIEVENQGDVRLTTQVEDILAAVAAGAGGFDVSGVTSVTFSPNVDYNGTTDPNTLTGTDDMAVSGSGVLTVSLQVEPGNIYTSAVTAFGTSPIGTTVSDDAGFSFAVYHFDIIPPKIEPNSRGVLPAVVLSTADLDARDIDPTSLVLEGVAPVRWDLEDHNDDGLLDLTLKFDRQDLLAAIEARLLAGPIVAASGVEAEILAQVAMVDVARAVLGDHGSLGERQLAALDRLGNGNGALDVGDLRALVYGNPAGEHDVAAAPKGGPSGTSLVLVLLGERNDGVSFMGEDALEIMQNGGGR